MKNLEKMQKEIVEIFFNYQGQGTKPWSYIIASHDLQYQIGNLTKYVLQLENYRYRENLSDVQIKEKLADELADILAEILFIAHELDVNIEQAWAKMLELDRKKIGDRSK